MYNKSLITVILPKGYIPEWDKRKQQIERMEIIMKDMLKLNELISHVFWYI